jgi:hypothetical protein
MISTITCIYLQFQILDTAYCRNVNDQNWYLFNDGFSPQRKPEADIKVKMKV